MNTSRWFGLLGGMIFLLITLLLFGSSVHATWYQFPIETINEIAFIFAFGLGLNKELAYIVALITLTAIFYIGYIFGYRIHRKLK